MFVTPIYLFFFPGDKEESGFEDNASDTKDDDFDDSQEAENSTRENSAENEKNISVKKAQTPSSAKSSKVGADATDDEGMELIRFWVLKMQFQAQ